MQVFVPETLVGALSVGSPGPQWHRVGDAPLPDGLPPITDACQAEVEAVLRRTKAIFDEKHYHYALPSKRHADKFVRLGDALHSVFDSHRIAEWLLPHLSRHTVVIGDTGSMLPLLCSLKEQAQRLSLSVEIGNLDRYPLSKGEVKDAIEAIKDRRAVVDWALAGTPYTSLFVISVNSTGQVLKWINELAPDSKAVVICDTATPPCELSLARVEVTRYDLDAEGKCDLCRGQSHAIPVHAGTYELLPKIEYVAEPLTRKIPRPNYDFWTMMDQADAVELHIDVPDPSGGTSGRHFPILLNSEKLPNSQTFWELCVAKIREIESPDLIVIPKHQYTAVVEALCQEAHPRARRLLIPQGKISAEMAGEFRGVRADGCVLVADDALVTGTTLSNIRTDLHRITKALGIDPDVAAFVMVARPADQADLDLMKRYHNHKGDRFRYGWQVFLPPPDKRFCPWCQERKLLTDYRSGMQGECLATVQERIERLERPMGQPLLMMSDDHAVAQVVPASPEGGQVGCLDEEARSFGSFFGKDLRERAAFAAGACAGQKMIQGLAPLGGGIEFKVADLKWAYECYFEGVLLSSLLRTFSPIHVRCREFDSRVGQQIAKLDPDKAPGVLTELALAAVMGKIPSEQVKLLLARHADKDRWARMFTRLIELVDPK